MSIEIDAPIRKPCNKCDCPADANCRRWWSRDQPLRIAWRNYFFHVDLWSRWPGLAFGIPPLIHTRIGRGDFSFVLGYRQGTGNALVAIYVVNQVGRVDGRTVAWGVRCLRWHARTPRDCGDAS